MGELDEIAPTITACGMLLIAAHPWEHPKPFSRVWCLFEIHTAWHHDCKIKLQFTPREKLSFFRRLTLNFNSVKNDLGDIDARQANATVSEDKARILAKIEREGGVDSFNSSLADILEESLRKLMLQRLL